MEEDNNRLLWSFFIGHGVLYMLSNFFLIIVNLAGDFRQIWFLWPVILWGVILYGHYRLNLLIIRGYFKKLQENLIDRLSQ